MDDLTLTPSLRAAETCDLAEHRSMRLQGGQGYATNGRWVNRRMDHPLACRQGARFGTSAAAFLISIWARCRDTA